MDIVREARRTLDEMAGLLVIEGKECPKCGEARIDYLDILDRDVDEVECQSCGTRYQI